MATRKDFLIKDSEAKLGKLNKVIEGLKLQLDDRNLENANLEEQIRTLKKEVTARESVRQSRIEARGETANPGLSAAKKMKKIVQRRQLVDLARTQAEEVDLLRQELDRMRQKTFPSFIRAATSRVGADER